MATHHASPGEIVDLKTWANDLPVEASKAIIRTDEVELARLIFSAGDYFPENILPGPVILQCISGQLEIDGQQPIQVLSTGQLVYLFSVEPNSIKAVSDSVVLMTVVFP